MAIPVTVPGVPLSISDTQVSYAEQLLSTLLQVIAQGTSGAALNTPATYIQLEPNTAPERLVIDQKDQQLFLRQLAMSLAVWSSTAPSPGPTPTYSFEGICPSNTQVGDLVYMVTGGGVNEVGLIDITDSTKMPVVGCVFSKSDPTHCTVQTSNIVTVLSGLTPGVIYHAGVGANPKPAYPAPVPGASSAVFLQPVGLAISPTVLAFLPSSTLVKVLGSSYSGTPGVRKFLYVGPNGTLVEQEATDRLSLGKISLAGVSGISVDVGSARIVNVPTTPIANTDAVNQSYVDTSIGNVLLLSGYRAVANSTARDAIPAEQRSEGMLVRTNDTGSYWSLSGNLVTWAAYQPSHYRAVANNTARDALPASVRVEGMLVRTSDTGYYWVLEANLTTWTSVNLENTPPQYLAVANITARDAIPSINRVEGMLVRINDTDQYWTLDATLLVWEPYRPDFVNKTSIVSYLLNGDVDSILTTASTVSTLVTVSYLLNGDVDKIETLVGAKLRTDQLAYNGDGDVLSITTTITSV